MRSRRLLWRIYFCFLGSALIALAAMAYHGARSIRSFHKEEVAKDLLVRCRMLAGNPSFQNPDADTAEIDRLCKETGHLTAMRITVILTNGCVVGDSEEDPAVMNNHGDRPEIMAALADGAGASVRFSDTLRRNLMYRAVPLRRQGKVVGVVRTSAPLHEIEWEAQAVRRQSLMAGAVVAVLFAVVALYLSRRIARPLEDMRRVAERLARGDLAARVAVPDDKDSAILARTLNRMAQELSDRMKTVTRQRNEMEAVLSSMVEGVLAVDDRERIINLNHAAARLFDLTPEQARGRSVQETIRNPDIQAFIGTTLKATGPTEAEVILYTSEERFLQLRGTTLTDQAGTKIGVLVVMNDITRLKRLETVRQDFVANASHELKTPITTIKGCIETLRSSASGVPTGQRRFIDMLSRHTDRLGALVDDLLSLSRIEHDAERRRIPLESGFVCDVLRRAMQSFQNAARRKKIALALDCPEDLSAPINAALMEQAVGNLIDNAVKYSDEGARVAISGARSGATIEIKVADEGPGIERKHLARIFERFYRVDPARSRAMGGTGLGLSIVRHIAHAHRGTVELSSVPGQGSTFTIRIPCE